MAVLFWPLNLVLEERKGRLCSNRSSAREPAATDTAAGTGCIIINTVGPFDLRWNADGGALPP